MPTTLLILHTHPMTEEESTQLLHLKELEEIEILEIDLTQTHIDYPHVTDTILQADRVQVW